MTATRASNLPTQTGEIGDLATSLVRFLSSSGALPMRASCSLANWALRRRCWGVWTWYHGNRTSARGNIAIIGYFTRAGTRDEAEQDGLGAYHFDVRIRGSGGYDSLRMEMMQLVGIKCRRLVQIYKGWWTTCDFVYSNSEDSLLVKS